MHGGVGKDGRRKLIGWFSKGSTYHLLSMGKKPFGRKFLRGIISAVEIWMIFSGSCISFMVTYGKLAWMGWTPASKLA
ncbi:unnamed protein product [Musa acuminata subsp. burmannicoides]